MSPPQGSSGRPLSLKPGVRECQEGSILRRSAEDSWVGMEPAYTHFDLRTRGLDHSCGTPALAWPGRVTASA